MAATAKMTEEQMVGLVRNALLVAGMEMGAEGDHWPVIKDTIFSIMRDWEDLKTERCVSAAVKEHYEKLLKELETIRAGSPEQLKKEIDAALIDLRALYSACFAPVNDLYFSDADEEPPSHIKRAKVIIDSLGGDDV